MLISIITVCRNSEKVLPQALASLRVQTHQPREWVVIDGASTDGTLQIIAECGESLGDWVSESDTGIYNAMNKGIDRAKGEVLFFLNSDDALFDSEVLSDVAAAFAADPRLDFLFGNVVYQYPAKRVLRTFAHINANSLLFEDLCHQAVFARRALFKQIGGFDERFRLNADYDWLIRAFRSGARWKRIDRTVAVFTAGGAHMQSPAKLRTERHAVRRQYLTQARWLVGDFQRRILHRWHRHLAAHPLGKKPLPDKTRRPAVVLLSHGFSAEYELGYANGLARNGVQVMLIGSDTTAVDRLDSGIELVNLRGSQRGDRPRLAKVTNLLRYFARYFALIARQREATVHVIGLFTTRNLWVSVLEAWITRVLTGGYILTVHNLVPHDHHTVTNHWLGRLIFQSATVLMVHTEKMATDLRQDYGRDPSSIVVVEHGIERLLPRTQCSRDAMRLKLGVGSNERVVLFFGAIARYKGVDVLLRAFELPALALADKLVIAGRCRDSALLSELQSMVASHSRREAIVWRQGYIEEDDVGPLFHAADVLAMPYRHIDQSGVIFMAMATGLRTVVTDVGALRDYVGQGFGLVAPVGDPAALAECIATLLIQRPPPDFVHLAEKFLWQRTVVPILLRYNRETERMPPRFAH